MSSILNGLSETHLQGHNFLPTRILKIPSSISKSSKFQSLSKTEQIKEDPELYFQNQLANEAGTLEFPRNNNIPFYALSWSIINDQSSLLLAPIMGNKFLLKDKKLCKIQIDFPEKIHNNCHIVRLNDDGLHIDLITENGILTSLLFDIFEDFFQSKLINNKLSIIENWCFVSIPYDFETRIPQYLQSINGNYFLIFLKDGGILKCERSTFKEEIKLNLFNDSSYISSRFGKLGIFFPKKDNLNDDENESNYNVPKNCSLKTILDSFIINNEYLVTITLNKKIKIWSIDSQSLLLEKKLNLNLNDLEQKLIGDGMPLKLLSVFNGDYNNNYFSENLKDVYFMNYLPIGEGEFKLWNLNFNNDIELIEINIFSPIIPNDNSVWLIKDFKLIDYSTINNLYYPNQEILMNFVVLLKSNTSSVYQLLTIFKNGGFSWIKSKLNNNITINNQTISTEYFTEKILNDLKYSNFIIETALGIYIKKNSIKLNLENLSIKEKLVTILNDSIEDSLKQWQTFESLCQGLLNIQNESISLNFLQDEQLLIVNNSKDFSIVKESQMIETFYNNKDKNLSIEFYHEDLKNYEITKPNNILKFLNVLENFKNSLSQEITNNIEKLLLESSLNKKSISEVSKFIFDNAIAGKIDEKLLEALMNELNSINDAFKIIGFFLKLPNSNKNFYNDNENYLNDILTEKNNFIIDDMIKLNFFKKSLIYFEKIYFDILLMTFILNFDENTSNLILSNCLSYYKKIQFFKKTLQINYLNDSNDLVIDLSNIYDSIFYRIYKKHFINDNDLFSFILDEKFYFGILNELSKTDNSEIIINNLLEFSQDDKNPIFQLFLGLTYLNIDEPIKSSVILKKIAKDIINFKPNDQEKLFIKIIMRYFEIDSIFELYYNFSINFKQLNHYSYALEFSKLSIEKSELKFFTNYFEISLELQDFEKAFDVLKNFSNNNYEYLEKFIKKIIKSNDLKNLIIYPFNKKDCIKIDEILFKFANGFLINSYNLNDCLKNYQILYSWRLNNNNIRGACEALYEFINKYDYSKNKESNDEITNLYEIIINLLNNFKNDEDKWLWIENLEFIYEKKGQNKMKLVYLDQLLEELNQKSISG